MRALILSDIHANMDALDAVLAAVPAHDVVWNLGDLVGYGAQPNEVIERSKALGSIFVRGNHDRAVSGLTSLAFFNPIAARAARWTQQMLAPGQIEWLRTLAKGPVKVAIEPTSGAEEGEDREVSLVHGSVLDEDEYLLSVDDAVSSLRLAPARITFFGHTHRQGGFATNAEDWFTLRPAYLSADAVEKWDLELKPGARYLINPGSVGQPRDGDWRSAFAVFDSERKLVELHRVPYDVRQAQARILQAGLPDRLASRLRHGR